MMNSFALIHNSFQSTTIVENPWGFPLLGRLSDARVEFSI